MKKSSSGNKTLTVVLILVLLLIFFIFSSCSSKCCISEEGYWSLPFAGGDVVTDYPDPRRIESPLWKAMDQTDMSDEDDDYPV